MALHHEKCPQKKLRNKARAQEQAQARAQEQAQARAQASHGPMRPIQK